VRELRVYGKHPFDGPGWTRVDMPPDACINCWRTGTDFAHGVYEALAMTLAQPLRKALDQHLDEHGCGTGDTDSPQYIGGFFHCPEAKRLFELLPDDDRILIA
jgi:hypothetical protein